jgi:hypothetical protein
MRIVATGEHRVGVVDPFGAISRVCRHDTVLVHITDARMLGDDLVECPRCGLVIRLADVYAADQRAPAVAAAVVAK